MSSGWRPDDSLLDRNSKGQVKGARRVNDVLRKGGIRAANRITTSRDQGMSAARTALKRTGMPTGVEQWQLPVALPLEGVLVFISRMKPGAVVPLHAHRVWVFRIVISGSLKYAGKTLKPGDWMLVPPGKEYTIEAGPKGCVICYAHCLPPGPPGPVGPPEPGPSRLPSG
jgi:quercetin dioxygenase-like cupin family protein